MNDRYLYRAKQTCGVWAEGHPIIYEKTAYLFDCAETWQRARNLDHVEIDVKAYEVDPSTICQCSGKPDKNNNLIFENDLVKAKGTVYVCRFDEDNFSWEVQNREETIGICCFHSSDIEITGNAIDNPELLEVGE